MRTVPRPAAGSSRGFSAAEMGTDIAAQLSGLGKSLLLGALPLVLGAVLLLPLAQLAVQVCSSLGFGGLARSFELLLNAFQGGELAADSREFRWLWLHLIKNLY